MVILDKPVQFLWDKGNKDKNLQKHGVANLECEEVFFDPNKKILRDSLHSGKKPRYLLLGKTKSARILFIAFTVRQKKVRVISARDLNKRERHLYEKP